MVYSLIDSMSFGQGYLVRLNICIKECSFPVYLQNRHETVILQMLFHTFGCSYFVFSTFQDKDENLSWKCYCCRSLNVSSFVYNAYNVNVSNSFAPLAGILDDDGTIPHQVVSPSGVFEPKLHSSPAGPNRLHRNE